MINTLVLDFGRVLGYPMSGNWFIPYGFINYLGIINAVRLFLQNKKLNEAFNLGNEYLAKNHLLFTEEEEYAQFIEFYKIIFAKLKIKMSEKNLGNLAWDIVYNDNRIKLYDDVIDDIKKLKQKYKVIILSDAWPSLKRVLKNNGILELLDGLVISCNYNETKETTKLFEIAAKEHNLIPAECVYIDDSIDNLKNAEKAGFKPILMDRRNDFEEAEYPVIKSLNEIEGVIEREWQK